MMTDYLNKKVNFQYSKISVKITKQMYSNTNSKIYLCSNITNPSISYCLKVASARKDDKATSNSINSEIYILVFNYLNK